MNTYYCKELDKHLPSVTTILSIIAKGEGFNNWLKKQGDNADKILEDAGDFGKSIHNLCERIGKDETINLSTLKPKEQRCINSFLDWKNSNIEKFIATEQPVFNVEKGYAGTLDSIVKLKDRRLALLDYKTSGAIYKTYDLQAVAYLKAYELSNNIKIDTIYILRFEKDINKKKDIQIKEVKNIDTNYEIFLCVLRLYNWNKKEA